jgi:hypothetical protein
LFTNETKYFKEFENVDWWIQSEAVNRRTNNTMAKRKKAERDKQWSIKYYTKT